MALDMWTHEFCLACDRQVQVDGDAYCSEACRMADFEKTPSTPSSQASSPGFSPVSYSLWPKVCDHFDATASPHNATSTSPQSSTLHNSFKKMPEQRKFGTEISGNRQRNHEFSDSARAAMLAMLEAGKSARAVAREFSTTHSTVLAIKKRWTEDHTEKKRPRSGRPKKLSRTEIRYIVRMIKKDRSVSWNALIDKVGGHVSYKTVRRAIRSVFSRKWKALERPKITPEAAAQRLQFARIWLPRVDELIKVMFSDEVTAANKSSNPNTFVFRFPHEKYNQDLVNLMDHVKPAISIMFWAAIWEDGRTPLVTMKRDPRSPANGYTAWSYREALREGLLPLFDGTRELQQDNCSLHNAESTRNWLLCNAISWIDWPPYSPDLNPIEHAWALLKRKLRSLFPDLRNLKNNEADRARFEVCAKAAWEAIPQDQIRGLLESLPRRLRAVIRARGWYTKY